MEWTRHMEAGGGKRARTVSAQVVSELHPPILPSCHHRAKLPCLERRATHSRKKKQRTQNPDTSQSPGSLLSRPGGHRVSSQVFPKCSGNAPGQRGTGDGLQRSHWSCDVEKESRIWKSIQKSLPYNREQGCHLQLFLSISFSD